MTQTTRRRAILAICVFGSMAGAMIAGLTSTRGAVARAHRELQREEVKMAAEILRATVEQAGDRPAVFWKIGASWHHLTYAQMLDQIDSVASGLIGLGVSAA